VTSLGSIAPARARELVARFSGVKVCVVGDAMIDRFVVGRVSRISPEAPVPVVRFEREYSRLGGAANVAHNLAALGARVALVTVIGADAAAGRLRALVRSQGLEADGLIVDNSRPTIEKVRIVTDRNQQVARIDYEEDADVRGEIVARMANRIGEAARGAQALLVSDYLKGVVTRPVVESLLKYKSSTVPLVIDPKVPHLDCYRGATLVTPNHAEAETATHCRIRTDDDAAQAAALFRQRVGCEAVLITRGEHGMWLSSATADGGVPAYAREVADVTGAGDTVAATVTLALAAGASLPEAAMLANHAASVVVAKFGPAVVTGEELIQVIRN
jgi:D-beta-D-heptose 7-phosphate kinase/D-beta-D-heptose 1-phosphate adenosyltransferase